MSKILFFAAGFLLAVVILAGGVTLYFITGMAPAATADAPMPFEKTIARVSLRSHTNKFLTAESPVPGDEANMLAGADLYKQHCEVCHGLPGQPLPEYAVGMYPTIPQLFKGKGDSNNAVGVINWKIVNGIRLTGMPAFNQSLSETQMWQLTELLKNCLKLPDSVKKELASAPPQAIVSQLTPQKPAGK